MRDFTHIALLGGPPIMLVVYPGVPARTLAEFIAFTRSRPAGVAYASAGVGTQGHLLGETFRRLSGAKLFHVPYKGGGPAVVDVIAGHVPATFNGLVSVMDHVRAGKLRPLAISSKERLAAYSSVPTFAESGYPELSTTTWFALSGPAGLPRDIVRRLNAEVRAVLAQPDVRGWLQAEGIEANDLDADAVTAFVGSEIEHWAPLVWAAKTKD